MNEERFRNIFIIILLVFISALFLGMIRPFLMTILLAAIFSGLAHPLHEKLLALFRGRNAAASICTLLILLIAIIAPLLFFLGILASEAVHISEKAGPWIQKQVNEPSALSSFMESLPGYEKIEPYHDEILTKLGQLVGKIGNFLVSGLSATTKRTAGFSFQFFLLLYAMFFFLMDGRRMLKKILYYVPLSNEDEAQMVGKFISVTRATLKGTLIIGVIQGVLGGIAFAVAGIQGAVFWGTIMMVLSVIPGIGSALVWIPAVVYFLATGAVLKGVLLAVFCALVVGSVDNILRPILVGKDVKMHELLILFGTLGGILFFGVIGFIIGPIVAALFVTIWEIYGIVFRGALPPTSSPVQEDSTED